MGNYAVENLETVLTSFVASRKYSGNNAYFEKLIGHLAKEENTYLLQAPVLLTWIDNCVNTLIHDFEKIDLKVVSFLFRLCAIVIENNWQTINLCGINILERFNFLSDIICSLPIPDILSNLKRITTIAENNISKLTPSVKLGHIRLLTSISKYSLGFQWIRATKSWHYLLRYCIHDQTLYIVREASCLLYEILFTFSTKIYDKELCLEILAKILKPINKNVYEDTSMVVNIDDTQIQRALCSTLDLISIIFQRTLESNERTPIPHFCEFYYKVEINIWKLSEMTHNEYFLTRILKAQTSYNFALLVYEKWKGDIIDPLNFNRFGVNFFNTMKFCIARRGCVNFLKIAKLNHYLWNKLRLRVPSEIFIENESIQFENQLIMFHVMPVLCIVKTQQLDERIFDQYVMKLFSISSEFIIRICYSFRDILQDCPNLAAHLAYKSIHGILSMKAILNKDQAVVVFQALVYVLKEFAIGKNTSNNNTEQRSTSQDLVLKIPQVLSATIVCLHALVEEYNITWKECVETMCLMDMVLIILKNPNLSSLTIVQAVKLTQLSIEHFLSPNMALLIDDLIGSGLQSLVPIIINNIYSKEWEVRDSTLELITSVVSISRLKFPAFQQYVLESDICSLVYTLIRDDEELYVRATGLKCLTQMITVNVLWEKKLMDLDLTDFLLWIICKENEGIVRKEAINCITQMNVYRRLYSSNRLSLYETLAHCAVYDLYWEVKVAALNFWDIEIYLQFTNQGMIDGTFPTVTFSKEHKKIVRLTEAEILLRIKNVLKELSEIGCLDVILRCLYDDCDFEVVKVAVRLIQKLFAKLKKYDYEKALNEVAFNVDVPDKPNWLKSPLKGKLNFENNEIIKKNAMEVILSTNNMQLLTNSYKKGLNIETKTIFNLKKRYEMKSFIIDPFEFLKLLKDKDLDGLIENRKDWLNSSGSLSSLLNDIILSGQNVKPFEADCY